MRVSSWATAGQFLARGSAWQPAVAKMGAQLAVVWRQEHFLAYRLMFSVLDETGRVVLLNTPIDLIDYTFTDSTSGSSGPSLAWSGTQLGMAWKNRRTSIAFARLLPSGEPVGESSEVLQPLVYPYVARPTILWNGEEYGLFWAAVRRDYQNGIFYPTAIYFTRIDALGRRAAGDTLIGVTCGSAEGDWGVDASWNGSEYSVLWNSVCEGQEGAYFTRLNADGSKIGGDVRGSGTGSEYLAWGAGHATHSGLGPLAWADSKVGIVWVRSDPVTGNTEIMLTQMGVDGRRLVPDRQLSHDPSVSRTPALAWTGRDFAAVWIDERDGTDTPWTSAGEVYFRLANCQDCDDGNARAYPGAPEVPGNLDDESCDGSLEPCDPRSGWRNHGAFVTCVRSACFDLVDTGDLTSQECSAVVSDAAKSKTGFRQ